MKQCKKLKDRKFDLIRQETILATASFSEGGESAVIVKKLSGPFQGLVISILKD